MSPRVPPILSPMIGFLRGWSRGGEALHLRVVPRRESPSDRLTTTSFKEVHRLGSPVVPFTLFWGSRFPYKVTNPKRGALIRIWLLGYEVGKHQALKPSTLNPMNFQVNPRTCQKAWHAGGTRSWTSTHAGRGTRWSCQRRLQLPKP